MANPMITRTLAPESLELVMTMTRTLVADVSLRGAQESSRKPFGSDSCRSVDQGGRDSTRAAQADSYGDSGFDQSRGGYGSSGLSGEGNTGPSDDFGARGGVSAGGVGDSRDCKYKFESSCSSSYMISSNNRSKLV
jgi:hypothetical protein